MRKSISTAFFSMVSTLMVLGIVLLYATVGIIGLLLGDLMMALMDPRINLVKKGGER